MNQISLNEIEQSFKQFLIGVNHPLDKPLIFDSKEWQQYSCPQSKNSNTSARYRAHSDGTPYLKFICWRCVINKNFPIKGKSLSLKERQEIIVKQQRHLAEAKVSRYAILQQIKFIWNRAKPCINHPYFDRKGLIIDTTDGLRVDRANRILCPVTSLHGVLLSIQTIPEKGLKLFYKGASPKYGLHIFGSLQDAETIFLAEGVATSLTIKIAINSPTICVYGKHFDDIASIVLNTYPNKQLVYCCDMAAIGEKVTSVDNAKKAIATSGGKYVLPDFSAIPGNLRPEIPRSDFNDLFVLYLALGLNRSAALCKVRQHINEQL